MWKWSVLPASLNLGLCNGFLDSLGRNSHPHLLYIFKQRLSLTDRYQFNRSLFSHLQQQFSGVNTRKGKNTELEILFTRDI